MSHRPVALEFSVRLPPRGSRVHALADALRSAIRHGHFRPGARVPASRELADRLKVARGTVVGAYTLLLEAGYLEARHGSGTFIAHTLPSRPGSRRPQRSPRSRPRSALTPSLSRWGEQLSGSPFLPHPIQRPRPFRVHVPAVAEFPLELWTRLVARRARQEESMWLDEADVQGYRPLREALADHLQRSRGVRCHAEQIVVLPSVQQALDLVARLTLNPGDAVWCEDPGYAGACAVFTSLGAQIVPVPVDQHGLNVATGIQRAPRAKLAYVTPSHQAPLGVTTSPARRRELLAWAPTAGALIVEDDYDSEYVYEANPAPSLQSRDRCGVVVYTGTFSKTLLPSLRLAYAVLPDPLRERFVAAKSIVDRYTPPLLQAALTDFMEQGHFLRHLRRMRELYGERRAALIRALRSELEGFVEIIGARAGLDLTVKLPPHVDDLRIVDALAVIRMEANALSPYSLRGSGPPGLVLGFAPFSPARLKRAVESLARVIARESKAPTRTRPSTS